MELLSVHGRIWNALSAISQFQEKHIFHKILKIVAFIKCLGHIVVTENFRFFHNF